MHPNYILKRILNFFFNLPMHAWTKLSKNEHSNSPTFSTVPCANRQSFLRNRYLCVFVYSVLLCKPVMHTDICLEYVYAQFRHLVLKI